MALGTGTVRYQIKPAPTTQEMTGSYLGYNHEAGREEGFVTIGIVDEQGRGYDLLCYIDHLKREGYVDGEMLDIRKAQHYFEGNCRGIPFDGDAGNDYPVRGIISFVDGDGWLEFRPLDRELQIARLVEKLKQAAPNLPEDITELVANL